MAPGRPVISVGIQPQIALYSVILGSVCAFGWYSEKYWRDEGDLDGHIKKLYLQDAQDAQVKMPQMAAAIRGQTMDLDGRMDKMVWGGKAQLLTTTTNGGSSSSIGSGGSNNNDETPDGSSPLAGHVDDTDDSNTTIEENGEKQRQRRRRKKRKRKKKAVDQDDEATATAKRKEEEERALLEQQKQKLILQSSIAGIAVGAVTVAAVSALMGGSGGRK